MEFIFVFTLGILTGVIISYLVIKAATNYQKNIKSLEIKTQFSLILNNIKNGRSKFKTRVKDTVILDTTLPDFGEVSIIYFMEKKEISICKEDKCIYTSTQLEDQEIVKKTASIIEEIHRKKIDDVIEVMGITVYRKEFEKNMNIQIEDIRKQIKIQNPLTDIDKIRQENNLKLDVDEILDKISKQGIESLTQQELEFLKKIR